MKFDVAIIGTGPGGGMAACRLAQSGLRIIVLEKRKLPRHKPCGGAMPERILKLIDWDITPLIEAKVWKHKYLFNYSQPFSHERTAAPMLLVSRSRFDAHFIERAVGQGQVMLREAYEVTNVVETDRLVTIYGKNQETIQASYVIAADGAFSPTARSLGLSRTDIIGGAAIDAEIEVTSEVYDTEKKQATFNVFCLPHGYGWIFPKAGYLSCGVAAWRKGEALPKQMKQFLQQSLPADSIKSIKSYGHAVPLFKGHRQIATRRICFVGDAAHLVDPILGEGIYYAVKSGALAAETILNLMALEASTGDRSAFLPHYSQQLLVESGLEPVHLRAVLLEHQDCSVYQQIIRHGIGRALNITRLTTQSFFNAPELFYQNYISVLAY